jgi:hypothetical protein
MQALSQVVRTIKQRDAGNEVFASERRQAKMLQAQLLHRQPA